VGRRGEEPPGEAGSETESETEPTSEVIESGDQPEPQEEILPPGPLAGVRIVPRKCRMLPGASRSFLAKAVDAMGRRISEGVVFDWAIASGTGVLQPAGDGARFSAPEETGTTTILVKARALEASAESEATVEVVEKLAGERPDAGIPDPKKVFDGSGDWRSRVVGRRWEYNAAHPDYQAVVDDPKRRVRYLVHLFAKEIVLRNHGGLEDERLLERMVEVLTHIRPRT
jgi:hypothetical protein